MSATRWLFQLLCWLLYPLTWVVMVVHELGHLGMARILMRQSAWGIALGCTYDYDNPKQVQWGPHLYGSLILPDRYQHP